MQIIGIGEMEQQLRQMISAKGLQNQVRMTGAMSPDEVRACMEKADIFLFSSDRNEGWGAVLNEALNSACAVVACREIGSVPYLIEDGVNGMIFDNRGTNTLYSCVERLLRDKERKTTMQNNAYETMKNVWNADAATDRLLRLIDCIQKGGDPGYASGPCSREE
jgi:glycosyltransferase involved in cell wall biosynthesis